MPNLINKIVQNAHIRIFFCAYPDIVMPLKVKVCVILITTACGGTSASPKYLNYGFYPQFKWLLTLKTVVYSMIVKRYYFKKISTNAFTVF